MKNCTKECLAAKVVLGLALPAIAFFGFGPVASAQSYDLFQTGSGANVDLSNMGFGVVQLQGVPIQTATGNTDTMMQRGTLSNNTYPVVCYALLMQSTSLV